MPDFAELLRSYRESRGLSQRALARAARINPAIISRLESGDRGVSGPAQALAIARALDLDEGATDALLGGAGFWPEVYLAVGPADPTLLAVARLLASATADARAKTRFRRVVELLVEQWSAQPLPRERYGHGG